MSQEKFQLKTIHKESIPAALEKAHIYRMLNDPVQAESICLDILEVEPGHQKAIRELILAMSEQFAGSGPSPSKRALMEFVRKLEDEYDQAYFQGLVCEREALALLERGQAAVFAYDGFREAMDCFEKADELGPDDNDEAILRWNSCVRTIRREKLKPLPRDEQELPLD